MSLIIRRSDQPPKRLDPQSFDQETDLQAYITKHPEAIPVDGLADELKLTVIGREFMTGSGPIDALGLDQQGQIYLIETKLYHNPDKRRIVSQLLDYAAALWGQYGHDWPGFDQYVRSRYDFDIAKHLTDEELETEAPSPPLTNFQSNLESGRFQLIALMDQTDDRLKDLVKYINQNSNFSLYAAELKYYQDQDIEIIIPELYGTQTRKRASVTAKNWRPLDLEDFSQQLAQSHPDNHQAILKFIKTVEGAASQDPEANPYCSSYPDAGEQTWCLKSNGYFPFYLNPALRLHIQCRDLTKYHRINRQLVDAIVDSKLFGRNKNDKTKKAIILDLGQAKTDDIEKLCDLYRQAGQKTQHGD